MIKKIINIDFNQVNTIKYFNQVNTRNNEQLNFYEKFEKSYKYFLYSIYKKLQSIRFILESK